MRLTIAVLLACVCVAHTRKSYEGYKVYNVMPTTKHTVTLLHDLMLNDEYIDFWAEPSQIGKEITFMMPPNQQQRIESLLVQESIPYTLKHSNLEDHLRPMWKDIDDRSVNGYAFDLNQFNTLDDINTWLYETAANCRTGVTCTVYSVGNSYEGRPMNVIHISSGTGKPAYWIDAAIHAREWISPATVLNVIDNFAYGRDADGVRLVDTYDWYIMPVMNVDGYEWTFVNDRMWRKNRRPSSANCIGTDLNRNFNFRWGNDGVSFNPCLETYCGPSGGSELETQHVSNELNRLGPNLLGTVTVHSYGNMWMFPWGNTVNYNGVVCDLADDHADMQAVSELIANAIENTYNTNWARGNSCVVIYATTGGTDDYAKGVSGVKYAFCPELRGNDFVINANQIALSYNEFFNGIVVMADNI